jgi:hypothetical protein
MCGNPPDASHVPQSVASCRHAFTINNGELKDSHDHSANNNVSHSTLLEIKDFHIS